MRGVSTRTLPSGLGAVDVSSSEFKANAYEYYAALRAEAPVLEVRLPNKRTAWLVSRYDDVAPLLKDPRLVKNRHNAQGSRAFSRLPGMFRFLQALERNMLDLDAPGHTRLRGLVHLAFTPRLVERMRDRIEQLSTELSAAAQARGHLDLIADYALPIPLTIISEMLGIPVREQQRFHRWSSAIVAATASPNTIRLLPAIWRFVRCLRLVIAAKRKRPADDLISALVRAEESGDRLRDDELVAMVFLLVIAGHETTVNLIGNGALALLQNPGQIERLRADPQRDATAIGELFRFHSPIEMTSERPHASPSKSPESSSQDVPCGWTSLGRGTGISLSAMGSTTASALRSPASKARSPFGRCSTGCRG